MSGNMEICNKFDMQFLFSLYFTFSKLFIKQYFCDPELTEPVHKKTNNLGS